jgi:hypothetical protein
VKKASRNDAVWDGMLRHSVGTVFVVVCVIGGYALAFLGWSTAYEFRINPRSSLSDNHSEMGALLGLGFAFAFGLAIAAIGIACSTRLGSGRFVIPGWSIHLMLVLVSVFALLLLLLSALGGMAGPYPTPRPAQAVGQLMSIWFPLLTAFGIVFVSEGSLLTRGHGATAAKSRLILPLAAGGIGWLLVLVAVGIAYSLSRLA